MGLGLAAPTQRLSFPLQGLVLARDSQPFHIHNRPLFIYGYDTPSQPHSLRKKGGACFKCRSLLETNDLARLVNFRVILCWS